MPQGSEAFEPKKANDRSVESKATVMLSSQASSNKRLGPALILVIASLIGVGIAFTKLFGLKQTGNQKRRTSMDWAVYFAAMQALGIFLQVWQGEQKEKRRPDPQVAIRAYKDAKEKALSDPEIQAKANRMAGLVQGSPVFDRLFSNRLGRCLDEFEKSTRDHNISPEELIRVAAQAKKCQCLTLEAIRTADGNLFGVLLEIWQNLDCPRVLGQ